MQKQGFTFIELVVVVGVLLIILGISIPALRIFERGKSVEHTAESIIAVLQEAQQNSITRKNESTWGVSFNAAANPNQYVLFEGSSFASRNQSSDKIYTLSSSLEFSSLNMTNNETVFAKLTGFPQLVGDVGVREKGDTEETLVFVQANGVVGVTNPGTPSDASRLKDARHVHIDYARIIDTQNETLTLTFPNGGSPVETNIIMKNYIVNSQFFWEGVVLVGGQNQELKLQTHILNDPANDTQFSLHRDASKNTKGFSVILSGDTTGNLATVDDSGQITNGTSLYVSPASAQ